MKGTETKEKFIEGSEIAFNKAQRAVINFNISKYETARSRGIGKLFYLSNAKKKAYSLKHYAIEKLDERLLEFEQRFTRNGGHVIWARTAAEATKAIFDILDKEAIKTVVKSKSMVTEEIALRESLENAKVECIETDLGEYIVQLLNQKPFHIVTPAMHLSKEEIAHLFHLHYGLSENASPEEIAQKVREIMREKFKGASVGITGANFLIPSIGGIAITENEGNARLVASFPSVHIAVAGIEKVLTSFSDLGLFWPLLATHGTGQDLTAYNTVIRGPRKTGECDGPEKMYVILLDNGRSDLLKLKEQRESLYCIRCGACLNVCPVYKNIGGHAYGTPYTGPIGSVISPYLYGSTESRHLSHASTLCGSCTEICPVHINLHRLLLLNRVGEDEKKPIIEKAGWSAWKIGIKRRVLLNALSAPVKQGLLRALFTVSWGRRRAFPVLAKKSFNERWNHRSDKL